VRGGVAPGREEVGVDEDERPAPAARQRGGARGVLDGEPGDDVAEERVGESAYAVGAVEGGKRGEDGVVGDGLVGEDEMDEGERAARVVF
jgi:hypothetical protein